MAKEKSEDLRSFASKDANKKQTRKKKSDSDRRNVWLLVATTLLLVISVALFMPPSEKINQGLDIQGGLSVVLTASTTDGTEIDDEIMEKSRSIIENRVNALGASETSVQVQGTNQILVQIPGMTDAETALATIGQTGKLEFARLDSFTDDTVRSMIENGQYETADTVTDEFGNTFQTGTTTKMSVEPGTYTPIVTGENLTRVMSTQTESGTSWEVDLTLDSEGTQAFAEATKELAPDHGQIVILLDGKVQSAPAVQSEIPTGNVSITGGYSQAEAQALQTVLESGSLPVSFTFSQSSVVGPTLGQGALWAGLLVALLGLALVMLYLLFFYRGLGMITAGAIGVFAILYLGILAGLSAFGLFSLTLSGIAGIVLTIGMAADSSVLTLERFREEIRMGRSVKAASITGVRHAILTSIDADLVTLVSALCLFFLASASVKGFGLTLALGICCDIIMMLIFKAPLIRLLAPRAIKKNPGFWGIKDSQNAAECFGELSECLGQGVEDTDSAFMINAQETKRIAESRVGALGSKAWDKVNEMKGRFIKKDLPFINYRKVFFAISAALIVGSALVVGIKGVSFGIEFVGGSSIAISDAGDLTTDELRSAFADAGQDEVVIQTTQENGNPGFLARVSIDDAEAAAALADSVCNSLGVSPDNVQVDTIGPDWGPSVIRASVIAFLVSLVLIILYIAIRFRDPKMGVIAVVALLHDLIIVVGVYALVGREINPNTIAALLTILGYSLYDTVVVFHRIIDNQEGLGVRCNFFTMANHSVNQVFIRTINTSLTSLIPVIGMLLFGGETLKDFAFAMVIGLIAGSYSSWAIATPLYSMWKNHEEKNKKLIHRFGPEVGGFSFKESTKLSPAIVAAAKEMGAQVEAEAAEAEGAAVAAGAEAAASGSGSAAKAGAGAGSGAGANANGSRKSRGKKRRK